MKEYYFEGEIKSKPQPMFDFNYSLQKNNKNPQRSMFQIYSPKLNTKNLLNSNPKEIFNATNKINSILSKNLKSIYNENKNNISKDTPIYENVNNLIQKNNNANKYIYNEIINKTRNSKEININDNLFNTVIKNNISLRKELDNIATNKTNFHKGEIKTPKNLKIKGLFGSKQQPIINFGVLAILNNIKNENNNNNYNNDSNILIKNKEDNLQRHSSHDILENNKSINKNIFDLNMKDNKRSITNNKNKKSILKKRRFSLQMKDNKPKINKKLNSTRNSFLHDSSVKMNIPTLKQINSAITKTFICGKMEKTKQELENLNNNEISEILDKIKKDKNKKKKTNSLGKITLKKLFDNNQLNDKDMSKSNTTLITKIDNKNNLDVEDKFQKKYRKIYLSKNLYDSLDDEEIIDEEKVYNFYISPNSLTVYILDFIVLIASLIELYYLPIYISLHISSFSIYFNLLKSITLCTNDLIYIIDLITGFFRAYYNFEEVLIKRNIDICLNYLSGWFIFDLIQAIPYFTILDRNMQLQRNNLKGSDKNLSKIIYFGLNNKYFALTVLKVLKVFKSFTYNRAFQEIYKFFDKSLLFYEWKGLFSSILIIFSCLHFSSCFFIFIGKNEFQGWILNNNLQDKSFMDLYIAALYYQMTTLTTVGYGDISATNSFEIFYGIFVLIVGTCAYSWILTYISNYIKKNNEKFIEFEDKVKILTEIKREYPNLNEALYERIKRYLNYNKNESKCNLKFILESLPSSLQNNLIIEIYKPIIMNFQFFKSFENSDFFVKIVTSLKPILSMKDDILIQEGDIIEDIIFIKKGILSLEVIIDLNNAKKSAEAHLEMTQMYCFKNISQNKFSALMTLNTMNTNYRPEFGKHIINNNKSKNKKEIKIIDLRKNEHFGDILMILNEKSPLTVKVKSKKAELFFLQKTEATEISNRYPNIWKRIVNRSLHNMKQIKNLIRKKVLLFIETYNIHINQQLKEKYLMNIENLNYYCSPKISKKDKANIETILEEDESLSNKSQSDISEKNINESTKEYTQKFQSVENNKSKIYKKKEKVVNFRQDTGINKKINEKKIIKNESCVKETKLDSEKNEKSLIKDFKKKVAFIEEKNKAEVNNNMKEVKEMINIIDKEFIKSNNKKQFNNFNINIYAPKINIPLNQINLENQYIKRKNEEENNEINNSSNFEKINNEISFNNDFMLEIKHNDLIMNNTDENCNIIYSKIKNKETKDNKNTNLGDYYDSNISKLFKQREIDYNLKKQKNEKLEIRTNDGVNIKSSSDDNNNINNIRQNNSKNNKDNKFLILETSQSTNFTIGSIYENINQISEFKYSINSELREKTKKFITELLEQDNKSINSSTNIKKHNNDHFLTIRDNMKPIKKKLIRKKSEFLKTKINLNKIEYMTSRKSLLNNDEDFKYDSPINIHKSKKKINYDSESPKKSEEKQKDNECIFTTMNLNKKKTIAKKKPIRRYESTKVKTFYNKINRKKTMKRKKTIFEEKTEKERKDIKINYNKLISKNIEENQQNLNNPEEYFEGFFNDIIFKKQGNNLRFEDDIKKSSTFGN